MTAKRALLTLAFVLGCSRGLAPAPAVDAAADLVAQSKVRPVANRVVGRFSIAVTTADRSFETGGALVLDRPGRGHLAVLGPLGAPLATLQSDGVAVAIALARGREHYAAPDAEAVLRDVTSGGVGLDDLFGLLVGDVPLDDAPERARRTLPDGGVEVVREGPRGGELTVTLAPQAATLTSAVARDERGDTLLSAVYGPYEPLLGTAVLVPTELTLTLPTFGASVSLKMKSWTQPEALPDVFGVVAPEGFTSRPLAEVLPMFGTPAQR